MIAAGANVMIWLTLAAEWQCDWARSNQAVALTEVITQHAGGSVTFTDGMTADFRTSISST